MLSKRLILFSVFALFSSDSMALQVQTETEVSVIEGETYKSVSFSPLTQSEHVGQGYLLGRRQRVPGRFNLALYRLGTNNRITFVKTIFDTAPGPAIHAGEFHIVSAYDPSVAWYRGAYWVAFECIVSATDIDSKFGINSSSSTCIGPLDHQYNLIASKTRLVVMGGENPETGWNIRQSASVPKLVVDGDHLYLIFSSVQLNFNVAYIENRRQQRMASLASQVPASWVSQAAKFSELADATHTDEFGFPAGYLSWNRYFSLFSCSALSGNTGFRCQNADHSELNNTLNCASTSACRSAFYNWQANTLLHVDRALDWKVNSNSTGLSFNVRGPFRFDDITNYGAEVEFVDHDGRWNTENVPMLYAGRFQARNVVFSWQTNHFTTVLAPENSTGNQVIADISDVKKFGNHFYFTVHRGGLEFPGQTKASQDFCSSPTTGSSELGCYRLEVIRASSPLAELNASQGEDQNMATFFSRLQPERSDYFRRTPHEYSRFVKKPDGGSQLIAKYVDSTNGTHSPDDVMTIFDLDETFSANGTVHFGKIPEGTRMVPGDVLYSQDRKHALYVSSKGLFVLNRSNMTVRWRTAVNSGSPSLNLQSGDHHLVFRTGNSSGVTVCYNGKNSSDMSYRTELHLQNDGNLVHYRIVGSEKTALWNTFSHKLTCR